MDEEFFEEITEKVQNISFYSDYQKQFFEFCLMLDIIEYTKEEMAEILDSPEDELVDMFKFFLLKKKEIFLNVQRQEEYFGWSDFKQTLQILYIDYMYIKNEDTKNEDTKNEDTKKKY